MLYIISYGQYFFANNLFPVFAIAIQMRGKKFCAFVANIIIFPADLYKENLHDCLQTRCSIFCWLLKWKCFLLVFQGLLLLVSYIWMIALCHSICLSIVLLVYLSLQIHVYFATLMIPMSDWWSLLSIFIRTKNLVSSEFFRSEGGTEAFLTLPASRISRW